MKNKRPIFILSMTGILFLASCRYSNNKEDYTAIPETREEQEQTYTFVIPAIPEGYVPDKSLYLAEGDGIYAFIENDGFDYETIGAEICNGNAQAIRMQFEESGNPEEHPEEYAAIQNILGITEIYLGNYERAFEYFNDTIDFVNEKELSEKNKILTALYNNAGTVTIYLSHNATNDKQLGKAAELCTEPYMGLAIAVNQTGRVKTYGTEKDFGEMIVRARKLIEKEKQINDSPNFALFSAVKFMSAGYFFTGQANKAVELLEEYIAIIPNTSEYNLLRANLLSLRGFCYDNLKEYESAVRDFQSSIALARRTVNDNSKQLANIYNRLGVTYGDMGDWDMALIYFEMTIPGIKYATPEEKWIVCWNIGNACLSTKQYDKAKKYLLKAYVNCQMVKEDLGNALSDDYGNEVVGGLYILYQLEKNQDVSFDEWLKNELEQCGEDILDL